VSAQRSGRDAPGAAALLAAALLMDDLEIRSSRVTPLQAPGHANSVLMTFGPMGQGGLPRCRI